jgi:hypothetical protein
MHGEVSVSQSGGSTPEGGAIQLVQIRGLPDRAWRWTLRLALPLLFFVSALSLYWIWFDRAFGVAGWDTVVVGLPLAAEAGAVALWSIAVWCARDLV